MKLFTIAKTLKNKHLLAITALCAGTIMMKSCGKTETPVQEAASVTIITAIPTLGTNNVYFGSAKANTNALPFGGSMPYFTVATGTQTVKFTTASSTESLISKDVSFENNTAYTLILTGRSANPEFLVQSDAVVAPANGKALLRFINLSPDAPSLDVFVKDGASVITDRAYKASSSYIEVDAKKYIFELKEHGSGTSKTTLAETTLTAGKAYTVFAKGLLNPTEAEQPFSGQVISH